ncbi:MAG: hypothetical protein WCG79_06605 [Verrucomicrobiota bacterium]
MRSPQPVSLTSSYRVSFPWYIKASFWIVGGLAAFVLVFFGAALRGHQLIDVGGFGTQGDFFGGHIAAIVGCITLLVVVLTGYSQLNYERQFRLREHFLSAIGVIGQYDIAHPGCEQALRMLDYFSQVALDLEDTELLLILNTVMTKEIRKKLDEIDAGKQEIYVHAREARHKIQEVLKDYNMRRKGLL